MQRRRERRNLIHIGCYFFELTYFQPQRIDWVRRLLVWQWCIEKCKRESLHKNHYTRASIVTRSYSLNFSAFVGLFVACLHFILRNSNVSTCAEISKSKSWNIQILLATETYIFAKTFSSHPYLKYKSADLTTLFWCIFVTHVYPPKNPVGYLWSTKDI